MHPCIFNLFVKSTIHTGTVIFPNTPCIQHPDTEQNQHPDTEQTLGAQKPPPAPFLILLPQRTTIFLTFNSLLYFKTQFYMNKLKFLLHTTNEQCKS